MFYDVLEKLAASKGKSVFAVTTELGITASTVSYWKKKGTTPKSDILAKFAEYFNVSTDYLLNGGNETGRPAISDDDLKFALFGGDVVVTDKMFQEVKDFAQYVKEKNRNEKS